MARSRPYIDNGSPIHICGYAVREATARPAGSVRNMDGTAPYYAGVARLAHPNGKEAVVWYDQSAWQVYADGRFAPMNGTGVDNVVRWVTPTTARKHFRAILAETL
jgi:hypothetical protein